MRGNLILLLAIVSSVLFGCKKNETTINLTFEKKVSFILVNNSHLELCYAGFVDTVKIDADGVFRLNFDSNEDRFILLDAPEISRKCIIPLEGGSHYDIFINDSLTVNGNNSEGMETYPYVLQYETGKIEWSIFNEANTPREQVINKIKEQELGKFKNLLEQNKISKRFYNLIKSDRDCFYAFVSAWLDLWELMDIKRNEEAGYDADSENKVMSRLTATFDRYPPNSENLSKSPSWQDYALFMYIEVYKQFNKGQVNKQNVEKILLEQHIPFWFEQIKESFSGKNEETALAIFLYKQSGVVTCQESEECIPVYNYFKTKYPRSTYLKYFDDHMQKTIVYYSGKSFDPDIHFVQDMENIQTFSDLIAQFKGQKLYVDIWAMWCNPCRMEFEYNVPLYAILRQNHIMPLYISLDEDEKKWKSLVSILGLKGMHFRANKSFIDDLNQLYAGNNNKDRKINFSIPWCILIDEEGNIVDKHFKRASEILDDKDAFQISKKN